MVAPAEDVLKATTDGTIGLDYAQDFDDDLIMDCSDSPSTLPSFATPNRKVDCRQGPAFPISKHDDSVVGEFEYNWTIDDWSMVAMSKNNRYHSEPFFVSIHSEDCTNDGWWFRVLLMPKGYDKSERYVSLYLALDEEKNGAKLAGNEWSLCADFMFTIVNPETGIPLTKYVYHRFDTDTLDWGFSQFLWTDSNEEECICKYISSSNQVSINVKVRIVDDPTGMLWVSPASVAYDSKRATGCVGLQNQGATCYMNSILQSLFLTNSFRRSVYLIPTEDKQPHDSIPLALQRLFYALTFSTHPPNTNDLTASFGWDLHESFTQHDVQEFLRVLMDDLEEKFKQTSADGTIDKIFGGRVKRVIRCLNIPFESSRSETVYDVQMPVSGCPTLKDSFDSYVSREMMTGDNKYMAEGHGLQDAEMFNVFDRLPPVLHLILMRYRYDPHKDSTVKINDRFEFPEEIDLQPYMSDSSEQRSMSQEYVLHSVLVHSGDGHGGHYIAFIRPDPVKKPSFWLKFDDTRVTEVTKEEAMDDNFGGGGSNGAQNAMDLDADISAMTRSKTALAPRLGSREAKMAYYKRVTNAYMLVYIRKSESQTILCPFTLNDIPTHIIKQIEEEVAAEEAKRQEHLLQMTTVKLSVYTSDSIKDHPGYDLFCSEPHPACPLTPFFSLRLKKDLKVSAVIDALKAIDPAFKGGNGRLWTFAQRRNRTIRLDDVVYDSSLSEPSDIVTLGLLYDKIGTMSPSLQLYADTIVSSLETGCQTNQKSTIYVFFKIFDPLNNSLKPLHGLLVDKNESLHFYEHFIKQMIGVDVPLEYYEEVKVGRVDKIHRSDRSFVDCELKSGDVVVVVPVLNVQPTHSLLEYYDDIQNLLKVNFISVEKEKEGKDFEAVVSTKASLSDLLKLIGEKTGWSHDSIRPIPLADSLYASSLPRPAINKSIGAADLGSKWVDVLLPSSSTSPSMTATVFYELLSIPLGEILKKRLVKIKDCSGAEASLWVDKTSPISSLTIHGTDLLRSAEPGGSLHFYEMSTHKIIREIDAARCFSDLLNDDIFIDRFPDPDPKTELYIPGYMHHRDVAWGNPFMFKLIVGEAFGAMRRRLASKLGISNEREIAKLNIHLSRYGRPQRSEMTDDTILLPEMRELQSHEQLAIEHAERPRTPLDGSVKIKRSAPVSE